MLFSFISGAIIGVTGNFLGLSPQHIMPISMILGVSTGVVISIWTMSKILKNLLGIPYRPYPKLNSSNPSFKVT